MVWPSRRGPSTSRRRLRPRRGLTRGHGPCRRTERTAFALGARRDPRSLVATVLETIRGHRRLVGIGAARGAVIAVVGIAERHGLFRRRAVADAGWVPDLQRVREFVFADHRREVCEPRVDREVRCQQTKRQVLRHLLRRQHHVRCARDLSLQRRPVRARRHVGQDPSVRRESSNHIVRARRTA